MDKLRGLVSNLDHALMLALFLFMLLFAFKGLAKAGLKAVGMPGPASIFQ